MGEAAVKAKEPHKIDMEFVDEKIVDASLSEVGLASPEKPLAEKVEILKTYYEENYESTDHYVCDRCNGLQVEADPHCPFCGEPVDDAEEETTEETSEAKGDEEIVVDAVVVEEPAPKAKKAKEKASKQAKEKASKQSKQSKPSKTDVALVKSKESVVELSVDDLDRSVNGIRQQLRDSMSCAYDLGELLRENFEGQLWKLRQDESGKPRYTNWKQFIVAEIGISHTFAYTLIAVTKNFDRQQVEALGMTKLDLILKAPEEKREKMIAVAPEKTAREIAQMVREGKSTQTPPTPEKNRDRNVAVPIPLGRKTYTLSARPQKKGTPAGPAHEIADQPWVEIEMNNGVRQTIHIQRHAKTGVLQITIGYGRDS